MKILNVNSYYYSSSVHENLKIYMDQKIENFEVYVPTNINQKNRQDIVVASDRVIESRIYKKYDRFFYYRKQKKTVDDIISKINIGKYDMLHAHSLFTNGYTAMKISELYGIPYIATVRATDLNVFFEKVPFLRKTGIEILEKAHKVIFLSKPALKSLIDLYIPNNLKNCIEKKSIIIPNGLSDFWIRNEGYPKKIKSNRIKFLFVGEVSKRKNLKTVLKTLDLHYKESHLTVVGAIKDKKLFDQLRDKYVFNYKGILSQDKLIQEYRKHHIFFMPSIHETFGLVYGEAMSQGLPVIYTKDQGFDGLFDDGVIGKAVAPKNILEMSNSIDYILANYDTLSENCVKYYKVLNWEDIAERYVKLYEDVLSSSN